MMLLNLIAILSLFMPIPHSSDGIVTNNPKDSIPVTLHELLDSLQTTSEIMATESFSRYFDNKSLSNEDWTRLYRETLHILESPSSESKGDKILIPMLKAALASGRLNEADSLRAEFRLEIASKNRPGTPAADFTFTKHDNSETTLNKTKSEKPIILIFYDPDCQHCMDAIASIQKEKIDTNKTVIAIDIAEDKSKWKDATHLIPPHWINGFAGSYIEDEDLYVLLNSPTIYLLTSDKIVIEKDISVERLLKFSESE